MRLALLRLIIFLALGVVLGFFLKCIAPAKAETTAPFPIFALATGTPDWSRKACGAVCVVTFSPGGRVYDFIAQAEKIKSDNITLKIDGPCVSACTVAADKARPNVCITQKASFLFHNGIAWVPDETYPQTVVRKVRMDISTAYSPDILGWVQGNGGFPGKTAEPAELEKFLTMHYDQARRFFRVCK